jgi:hypothetical protein
MSIGIIGAGTEGRAIARALANGGVKITIANRRGPDSLAALVKELGPNVEAGTVAQAAAEEVVIVAVRFVDVGDALSGLPAWNGRIVVDATNPIAFLAPDSPDRQDKSNPLAALGLKFIDLGGRHSSQIFRDHVPGARVVKAFNHLGANNLTASDVGDGKKVLFFAGDDAGAKADIRQLIEAAGFAPADLGPLDVGGPLMTPPQGPFASGVYTRT